MSAATTRSAGHAPVLLEAAIDGLAIKEDGVYLDATFGRGGHARRVMTMLGPRGRLLLLDRDPDAIAAASVAFGDEPRVAIRHGAFATLGSWSEVADGIDGVLFDLGVSSPQLDEAARGFSFRNDGPLDMRMDSSSGESVAEWIAKVDEATLADVLFTLGEERQARRIARAIVAARSEQPITRTGELADLVARTIGRREPHHHPATRTFQALRMAINDELGQLARGLAAALSRLRAGGRLVVISFHSLEDRVVKHFIRDAARSEMPQRRGLPPAPNQTRVPTLRAVGRAIRASADELATNPRARSATLRIAERLS